MTTFDKKGKPLKVDARAITVKATGDVPPTGRLDRAVTMNYLLAANPKAVRARFVMRADRTGRMGTADVDLLHLPAVVSPGAEAATKSN